VQRLIADGDRHRNGEELAEKMHRLEQLIMSVTEQLRLLTTARMHEPGIVDVAVSTNASSAAAESSSGQRE
jgi:hypothetical protein